MHDFNDLITLFHETFFESYQTILVKGGDEPIYFPKSDQRKYAEIVFARGFFASALHEIAHWLVAGDERRKLEDYGYWYEPDGRSQEMQAQFQKVEIKPQAIEWILSKSCGFKFRISNDNLNAKESDTENFKNDVYAQVLCYLDKGLPLRTQLFSNALSSFYKLEHHLKKEFFSREELD